MNCPSRTDECGIPGWNQSPPFLAKDLTTCQDFNGMVNARELKRHDRAGHTPLNEIPDDAYRIHRSEARPESAASKVRGWAWWLLSVLCTSLFLSNVNIFNLSNLPTLFNDSRKLNIADHPRASLAKRDSCAKGGVNTRLYDLPLHVGALFIILFVSTTGCAFPMLVLKFPRLRIPASFLFTARHFGTGVLIATAFVHLLPTAFISLGNPCLSSFWTTDYPAMPGAIALAAIFFLTIIEMVFSPGRSMCSGGHASAEAVSRGSPDKSGAKSKPRKSTGDENNEALIPTSRPPLPTVVEGSSPLRDLGPLYGRSSSFSRTLARLGEASQELDQIELAQTLRECRIMKMDSDEDAVDDSDCVRADSDSESESRSQSIALSREQAHQRAKLQCVLLEMGILFHSVFIGMSLSVSTGSEFVILLIAIIFHQTFEGLALGARIANLRWPDRDMQPWLMAFAYGCTTPIGQAIGLATHTLYSPDSEVGLLVVGIMNAISSGLLVFASLVELLSEDFLSDESWRIMRGRKRVYACLLVFAGAFAMSLVGAWA